MFSSRRIRVHKRSSGGKDWIDDTLRPLGLHKIPKGISR